MTVTALPPTAAGSPRLGRGPRRALAIAAAAGPLLMAGSLLVSPYTVSASIPDAAAAIAAAPDRAALSLLLLFGAGLFGAAGALVVGAAVRRGAPRFGAVAAALAFVGFVAASSPGPVAAIAAAPAAGLDQTQLLALITAVDAQPLGRTIAVLFIGVPAGVLLLGIAALIAARRGHYPLWAAVLLTTAIPAVLIGGFVSSITLALSWLLVTVAFAAAGWLYARA